MAHLVLLRHAKAVKRDPNGDHARPLDDSGRAAATLAGQRIAPWLSEDSLVLSSDARRTEETVRQAFPTLRPDQLRLDPTLYLASREVMLTVLRTLPPTLPIVVLVGHNPGLSDLAQHLGGAATAEDPASLGKGLSPADAVVYEITKEWAEVAQGDGRIVAVLSPPQPDQ